MILLDTNVVSAVMLQSPDAAVVAWLDQLEPSQVWLPSVVVFELRYGAAVHPDATRGRKLMLAIQRLIAGIALAHQAQLATRNSRHFSDTSISLINPFVPMG